MSNRQIAIVITIAVLLSMLVCSGMVFALMTIADVSTIGT